MTRRLLALIAGSLLPLAGALAQSSSAPLAPYRLAFPEGRSERTRTEAHILSGARIINWDSGYFADVDVEHTIRALEWGARNGTLYDGPTTILGLQQRPRYAGGRDEAHLLVEAIAGAAIDSAPGTRIARVCNVEGSCDSTPFTMEELAGVILLVPISPRMNPRRGITVGTGAAAVMSYIATMRRPDLVTGSGKIPSETLAEDRRNKPGVDVVDANRAALRVCIKQGVVPGASDMAEADLRNCARVGARAAIYLIALHDVRFIEVNPQNLIRIPDDPNSRSSLRSPGGNGIMGELARAKTEGP